MIVGQHTLDKLQCESFMQKVEFEEVRLLSVSEETKVFKNGKCVTGGRAEWFRRPIRESYLRQLCGWNGVVSILDDHLVHDKHDKLAKGGCRC